MIKTVFRVYIEDFVGSIIHFLNFFAKRYYSGKKTLWLFRFLLSLDQENRIKSILSFFLSV